MNRRRTIALGVAASIVGAILIVAVVLWFRAGAIVARRAERLANERYGLDLVVRSASVSSSGIELEGVAIRIPGVDGFFVYLSSVSIAGSPVEIAARKLAAVRRIEIDRGDARIRLSPSVLQALAARRRVGRPESTSSTPSPPARVPPIHVRGFTVELVDDQGELVRARGVRLDLERSEIRGAADQVELGAESGDEVVLERARGTARRSADAGGALRISSVDVDSVDVRWASSLESLDRAADGRLVRRMRESAERIRDALASTEPSDAEAPVRTRLDRYTTRYFVAHAANATIATSRGADEKRLSLREIRLGRRDATRITLVGQGEGAGGISARWNLDLDPSELRAEGTIRVTALPLALVGPLVPEIPWEVSIPGTVSVDVELAARGMDEVTLRGSVALEGVALDSPRLSSAPIRDLALTIEGDGVLRPIERRLVLGSARFTTGGVPVEWRGRVELGPGTRIVRGSLVLPATSCERAVHAIPADVLGSLSGFHLSGTIAGRIDVDLDMADLDRTMLDVFVDDQCVFEQWPQDADIARFDLPFQHEVLEPDGSVFAMETGPGTPAWAPYGSISPYMVEAVVSHEDSAFFRHRGFAPWAIRDAVVRDLREGRYVVGASTITMQLAKNLFLHREKTLIRKVQEVLLTWWLERSLGKDRILELYLNVIEYGPGIYGLRAASRHYFDCTPAELSPVASAFLAMVLPAPKSYGIPQSGTFSASMRARIDRFLRHMADQGRIDSATLEAALVELGAFRYRSGGVAGIGNVRSRELVPGANELDLMTDSYGSP